MDPRVERLLRAGGSVCPFARACPTTWASVDVRPGRRTLLRAARAFSSSLGATPAHALVVVGPDLDGFEVTRLWAIEVFLGLWQGFAVVSGVPVSEAEAHADRSLRKELLDERSRTRPILAFGKDLLFAICMAPCYPETHPRYAPRPIVVTTWGADVAAVSPEVVRVIRQRMEVGHGALYDADALMLALPERAGGGR